VFILEAVRTDCSRKKEFENIGHVGKLGRQGVHTGFVTNPLGK
jgi:hypothetical protein